MIRLQAMRPASSTVAAEPGLVERRPLRVVIGLEGLALGGCPINALDLGWALRERGHLVNVFAIEEAVKVSLLSHAESRGFTPALLPAGAGIINRTRQLRELAQAVDADIMHVFGPWLGPAAAAAMSGHRRGAAVVTNWMMENVFYTPRDTPVIVGTQRLRDELETRHRGRVWLMEPPVDLVADAPDEARRIGFREEWGIGDDDVAVVVVGRVDVHLKAEGLQYAVRAIAAAGQPRLRLVIVGDGDAFGQLCTLAGEVNAALGRKAVLMTGALNDPRPAYDAADIALGMGGSALRVLAHGKPLIVLGERGFARIFEPSTVDHFYGAGFFGEHGPPDPVSHLASLIRSLEPEERRQLLGGFGLAEVRSRFGLDAGVAKLEAIYRTTLAESSGSFSTRVFSTGRLARGVVHERLRALRGAG